MNQTTMVGLLRHALSLGCMEASMTDATAGRCVTGRINQ